MHSSATNRLLRQFIASPTRCARNFIANARIPSRSCNSVQPRLHARAIFSTATIHAALAQRPPAVRTELVAFPSSQSLSTRRGEEDDEDEPEVELVPPTEATLEVTERAAEQLRLITQRENDLNVALRVTVESGGCHGYQYKMGLAKQRSPDDYHFSHPRIKPSNIYVDAVSMSLLKGSTVDYATELIGSSFRITDNPQAKNSGCGCGVSWELKL